MNDIKEKPQIDWSDPKPVDISNAEYAFPAAVERLMPPRNMIAGTDFDEHYGTRWNHVAAEWFFNGLPKDTEFFPKEGIDTNKALRHIGTVMRSWEPKHEHKEAACAWLLSKWFENIRVPGKNLGEKKC